MGRVTDKVALITGAARGQGRSHAVRLAEEGADIIAVDICAPVPIVEYEPSTPEDLAETARLVEKTGARVVTREADTRDRVGLSEAITSAVDELGGLDIVIANAGISPIGADRPLSAFSDTLDINLVGTLNTIHVSLPQLGENASIVVIGSVAAMIPRLAGGPAGPGGAGYTLSKLSLAEYVRWLAEQLAPSGTRVNIIHPTNTATEMFQNEATYRAFRPDLEHPEIKDVEMIFKSLHGMPISYLDPQDVSHAVLYFASDESRYVTGMDLKIDAGMLRKMGA